jgi:phosphomevalonate kinase
VLAVKEIAPSTPLSVRRMSLPPKLSLVAIWTREPASTARLVRSVVRLQGTTGYADAIAEIARAASSFAAACERIDAHGCVDAIREGGTAVASLGRAAGVPLETALHRRIAALAAARGGAAKPTGAGGGDLALAVFDDLQQLSKFRGDLAAAGMETVPLSVDPVGVRLVP